MYKVLISDNLAAEGQKILREDSDIDLDFREKVSPEELLRIIPEFDALIIRSDTKVTSAVLNVAKKLKVIGRAGVGIDNVDVPEATRRGIIVMNTPDGNTISTAEHTFSMLMAMARNIPQADQSIRAGKWDRKKYMGTELYGKVIGIVGLGRIGTELAKRALAFNMKILAYDPFISKEKADQLNVQLATIDEIISQADFITVHTPKSKETTNLFGKEQFAKMKPTTRLINCARGGIINQNELKEALQQGKIAGAALDVFEVEPLNDPELIALPNVILTPHLGASTEEAQINVGIIIAEQVRDTLKGGMIRNAVNIPSIPPELLKDMTPYMDLADRLGRFQAQLIEGQLKRIVIKYAGEVCDYPRDMMTASAVKGILSIMLSESLNFINARMLAKERGIEIIETTSSDTLDFTNTISLTVHTDKESYEIVGTVVGKKRDPHIVSVLDFHTDFTPQGNLLVFFHKDEPGIVGRMGTMLGNEKINIAALHMGRNILGGDAVSILNIDSEVPEDLIKQLRQTAQIKSIKYVKL